MRECPAQRQRLRALGDHHVAHRVPHAREVAVLGALGVAIKAGHAPERLLEILAQHADLGSGWRFTGEPCVLPSTIRATPVWADLAGVFAAALCDQAEAINGGLY